MILALGILGGLLIVWGLFVLITGNFVATLDIAASLIASGSLVIGLAIIARSLDRIALQMAAGPLVETEPEGEQADWQEPAPVGDSPVGAAYAKPSTPPSAEVLETREEPAEPTIVREGVIEGQNFRFYSDGSIEAEGPGGIRRFNSIDEAREYLLRERGRAEGGQSNPEPNLRSNPEPVSPSSPASPQSSNPAPSASPASPPGSRAPRAVADIPPPQGRSGSAAGASKPARDTVTWDTYLAGGREAASAATPAGEPSKTASPGAKPGDDEWSEPFRMMLRGGETGPGGDDKTRKD